MIFGYNRLPLIEFFKEQASESLMHANLAGEHITGLGGHPPLNINNIHETFKHDIPEILKETLEHEKKAIQNLSFGGISTPHLQVGVEFLTHSGD